jgi:hypothetical protein
MSQIDRRDVLKSLAGGTACAGLPCSITSAVNAAPAPVRPQKAGPVTDVCLIARQPRPEFAQHGVDFWSMPWAAIPYTKSLPTQITRNVIWHFGSKVGYSSRKALDFLDQYHHYCSRWIDGWQDGPRQFAACFNEAETLSSTLAGVIGDSKSERRIAIIALETLLPGKDWEHILPALSCCYDTIIGLYCLNQRGLRQQRASVSESDFAVSFLNPARFCDAVIVTSPALAEAGPNVSPSASTEELVGTLVRVSNPLRLISLWPFQLDQDISA